MKNAPYSPSETCIKEFNFPAMSLDLPWNIPLSMQLLGWIFSYFSKPAKELLVFHMSATPGIHSDSAKFNGSKGIVIVYCFTGP